MRDPRRRQPRAVVDHADQRRIDRRPAGESTASKREVNAMFLARVTGSGGGDAEGRLDDRPQAADRRAAARRSGRARSRWSAPAAPSSAVDTVGAGQDEMVLIVQGSSARLTPETEKLPVDATIIGIVDTVNVENQTIFSARE